MVEAGVRRWVAVKIKSWETHQCSEDDVRASDRKVKKNVLCDNLVLNLTLIHLSHPITYYEKKVHNLWEELTMGTESGTC